jgi:WD40 repeat protein
LHDENDENERETVQKVVQRLADSRLVTTSLDKGEETVQIIHDSLIREWALLQRWLKKDRAFLAWERELEKDAREWQQTSPSDLSGRDEGRLLRGRRLEEAERWQKERERDLGEADQEFINASLGLREREREKEERAKAEKERTRRRIIQGIAIFSIFSLALAGVAMLQKQQADEKTEEALARSLAAQSEQRRDIPGFLTESILLAIESLRHKSTVEGKIALHNSLSLLPRSLVKLDSSSKLLSVAFSSDGSKIASLNGDGNAYVWATRTGHQLHMIALNFSWFYPEMAFSPDGTKLALTDEFGDVGIWNLSMGNQSHIQLPSDCVDRIHFLKYSRDGKKLITACGQTAIISNTDNGRPIHFLKHNASIIDLELSDNSAMLATISEDMVVSIWDIESGRRLKKLYPDSQAIKLVFDHNSTRLAAACEDKAIRIWDANTGKMLLLLQNNEIIYDMDFSPNGEDFAIGLEDKAVILNINSDQKIELPASKSRVIDVLFSPDGRKLAMKSSFDNSTSIWDVKSGNELMRFENIFFTEAGSAFTPDGRGFAVVGTDRIWDTRNSKDLPEIDGYVRNMAYSPDGRIIATAGESNNTQIWDTRTLNRLQSLHNSADANDLKFSPDSRKLAVACSNGEVEVWDLEAGKKILNLHHNSSVNSISFSPDGLRLATASDDGFAAVWDVIAGTKLLDLPVNNDADAITFNNDGTELAAATYGPAYVWNAQTGEILQEFEQFTEKYVTASVAFNSDGTELVMSNGDGTARIWNIKTGKEARVLSHDAAVIFVAFNPASATLATGSMDGFVRIWNMKTGELLQEIEHTGTVRSMDLDFSPDGNNIVRTSDGIMQTFCIKNDILIKDACSRITENMTGSGWSRFMEPQDCLTCPREGRFNKSGIWPWEQENCQPCIESINASRV